MTKEIYIKWNDQKYTVLVDDDSYTLLNRHTWYIMYSGLQKKPYAFAELYSKQKGQKRVKRMFYLHQMVAGSFTQIDHKNGNTLDNQFDNLRPATTQQNGWYSRRFANRTHNAFEHGDEDMLEAWQERGKLAMSDKASIVTICDDLKYDNTMLRGKIVELRDEQIPALKAGIEKFISNADQYIQASEQHIALLPLFEALAELSSGNRVKLQVTMQKPQVAIVDGNR
jgi:hypothetical protein